MMWMELLDREGQVLALLCRAHVHMGHPISTAPAGNGNERAETTGLAHFKDEVTKKVCSRRRG
jgi:hypothetical protein